MSVDTAPAKAPPLVERAKNILLKPNAEWDRIATETSSIQEILTGYVLILAAIGPVCRLIGAEVFGYGGLFGVVFRPNPIFAVVSAVVGYVVAVAGVYVTALVIDALAPNFAATKDRTQAFKVAAYSSTAAWIAGAFGIFPPLTPLAILGLYSLYLLYLGLPKLMKAPQDKALPYTAVVVVVAIVIAIVAGAIMTPIMMMGAGGATMFGAGAPGTVSGQVRVGNATVDLGKMQQAANAMKAAAQAQQSGQATVTPVSTDVLSSMLPQNVAGYARGDISSSSGSAAGMAGSSAEATYTKGDASFTLKLVDLGSAAGIAQFGNALNVSSTQQTGSRYEKIGRVDGRMTTEEYDSKARSGQYSVLVGERFTVEADGSNVGIDDLKQAVNAVPFGRLEALKKS